MADDLKAIHEEAMRRADEAWAAERENIRNGRDCQRFYASVDGSQWDTKAKAEREKDGRPVLTINRLPQFVKQMTGDLRKAPPELKFLPAKEGAAQEAAEALNGIKRTIDAQSNGKDIYVIATENAAIAGQGGYRILTKYADDTSFDLEIRKKPIRDPFGFLIDPYAIEPDKSDMRYGFVFEHLSVTDFKATYPDAEAADMPHSEVNSLPWRVGDSVRIAEYWKTKTTKTKLYLVDGQITPTLPKGRKAEKERDVEVIEVCYYMMTGKEILSGPHEWAGIYIPICVVVGEEITQDGSTVRKGMVHDARDPQRVYNYTRSKGVEAVAQQPITPFIATVDQVKGHETMWKTAGSKNWSVLVYNHDPKAPGPPTRSPPPISSEGLDNQALIASDDMKAVVGIYDASLGNRSNETSGRAINARRAESDTATYLYPDNLSRAIAYEGKILADLIPKIYDRERVVRILKEDGTVDMMKINGPPDPPKKPIDLSIGKYDVVVSTGPSFASRRAEASANMTELVRAVPAIAQIAGDLVVKNMDFPGADEIAKRIERSIPPGVKDDGPQEPPPPDPESAASALDKAASADLKKAQTAKTLMEADQIAAGMTAMGAQIEALTTLVKALASGQPAPPMPIEAGGAPPMPAMGEPAPASPAGPVANGADGPPMIELDELEGAPV